MAVFRSESSAIEVLYKVTGRGTALLSSARRGDAIDWVGPLGVPFSLPPPGRRALLVGGGTGIASLYELAEACSTRGPLRVLLGARSEGDLMAVADFAAIPGVELEVATEDGSRGLRGLVTELLEAGLSEAGSEDRVYACGPTPMMARAAELSENAGVPCSVSLENHMACGFGVCLGCAVPRSEGGFALVCRDGPVFASSAVAWPGRP
jgi:dihydroorotate dehydrogenase electron transfer subunit